MDWLLLIIGIALGIIFTSFVFLVVIFKELLHIALDRDKEED